MINQWDERYADDKYFYGEKPNEYLKANLIHFAPGKILLPGEGEGRNAVFAAMLGYEVSAFDSSAQARNKALKLAEKMGVKIDYQSLDYVQFCADENVDFNEKYDFTALIYTHSQPEIRTPFHRKVIQSLRKGGLLILEGFNKKQLRNSSGGPHDVNLLFSKTDLLKDFAELEILYCEELQSALSEGPGHDGMADIVRLLAKKK